MIDRLQPHLHLLKAFLKRYCLKRGYYFKSGKNELGGTFAGGDCRKLLNHIDDLEQFLRQEEQVFEIAKPILQAMRDFNTVRKQCFGIDLDPKYKESIAVFAKSWLKCEKSITLKCHVLFVHVVQFLERMASVYPNKGLGFWAEQAIEAVHSKWDEFWEHRKVSIDHPKYDEILWNAGSYFNALHYGNEGD